MEELKMMLDKLVKKHKEAVSSKDVEGEVRAAVMCGVGITELAQKHPDQRAAILEFVFSYEPISQLDDSFYMWLMEFMDDKDYIALVPALQEKGIETHSLEYWAIYFSIKKNWPHVLRRLQDNILFFIDYGHVNMALEENNSDMANFLQGQLKKKSRTESPFLLACKNLDMELLDLFKEYGILDVKTKDQFGNCGLHHIDSMVHDIKEVKMAKFLIKEGIDINAKNNAGITPLMQYAMHGKTALVKLLLEHGADIAISSELTAYSVASDDEIKEIIDSASRNYPQKLKKILTNFTSPDFKPIRFTTHSWDFDLKKEYGNFETFMREIKKQWDGFSEDLEKLSPSLYQKIKSFLFETDRTKSIGWSSVKELQKWCDDGKDPFDLIVGDKKFEEYIKEFKQEIEIRKEGDHLETLFIAQRKKLGRKFSVSLEKLKGKTFYTDVEKFTAALDKIFTTIKDNADEERNIVEVKAKDAENGDFIDIIIVHNGSFSPADAKTLAREAKDGDFSDIRKNLTNLCDWSVLNVHEDKAYRVNYLRSNNSEGIVKLEEKPAGFTHILRFYK